jgi:hypothetical protein
MGHRSEAICKECGAEFMFDRGGGFSFYLLQCDSCYRTKNLNFDEIGELHLRFLKGSDIPYSMAGQKQWDNVRNNYKGDALSKEDYYKAVEDLAGICKCGGKFTFDAEPRCPKCGSLEFEECGAQVDYD